MANLPPGIPAGHLAHQHAPPGNPNAEQLKSPTRAQFEQAAQQQGLRDELNAQTDKDRFARARVEGLLQTIPDSNIAAIRAAVSNAGGDRPDVTVRNWIGM